MNNEFSEIEFKYGAGNVNLSEFESVVHSWFNVKKQITVSGYDDYYTHSEVTNQYLRHRYNADKAEITVKRRRSSDFTAVRDEVDLAIAEGQTDAVAAIAKLMQYDFDFVIYKTCQIYYLDEVNIVYYFVYNSNMLELARIIEIEANKDFTGDGLAAITRVEKILGVEFPSIICPEARLNKTMHELFTTQGEKV